MVPAKSSNNAPEHWMYLFIVRLMRYLIWYLHWRRPPAGLRFLFPVHTVMGKPHYNVIFEPCHRWFCADATTGTNIRTRAQRICSRAMHAPLCASFAPIYDRMNDNKQSIHLYKHSETFVKTFICITIKISYQRNNYLLLTNRSTLVYLSFLSIMLFYAIVCMGPSTCRSLSQRGRFAARTGCHPAWQPVLVPCPGVARRICSRASKHNFLFFFFLI